MANRSVNPSKDFIFESLTNCQSLQKTLRFKLIPQGRTMEYIEQGKFLDRDKKRHEDSQKVKEYIDEMQRDFIGRALENTEVTGWDDLEKALNQTPKEKSQALKKQREKLSKCFEAQGDIYKEFKKGGTNFVKKILPNWMREQGYTDEDLQVVEAFKSMTGYFDTFMTNRANMYLLGGEATSVFTRAIDDNFQRFLTNKNKLNNVLKAVPSLKECSGFSSDLLDANCYNKYLSPNGITKYNEYIGQLNSVLNEAKQNKQIDKKVKLFELYKQILCEGESSFFIPEKIENDAELVTCIQKVKVLLGICNKDRNEADESLVNSLQNAIHLLDTDNQKIVIEKKNIRFLSKILCENGSLLESAVIECMREKEGPYSNSKGDLIKKWEDNKIKTATLAEIIDSYCRTNSEQIETGATVLDYFNARLNEVKRDEKDCFSICELYRTSDEKKILGSNEHIEIIKTYLDKIKELEKLARIFEVKSDDVTANDFYVCLDGVLKSFKEFDKIYDQIRNYVTQKPFSQEKIILKFDYGTLCDGWDINKEKDNHAVLLKKGNLYYLGITAKDCLDLNELDEDNGADYYEKLIYKLVPGSIKMLPKVFFAKSRIESISSDLVQIKESKSFNEDPEDLQKYIAFYISEIKNQTCNNWDEWFNFNFKKPSEYVNFKDFCDDVDKQAYSMSFKKIPTNKINALVDGGKLFLFQLYNKDFSKYSTGAKNLHTLYWEQLFSERNFRDGFPFKLNGEASIYFRKASIENPFIHKSGDVLVNKTYLDKNGDRQTISDETYKAICEIENGIKKTNDFSAEVVTEISQISDKLEKHEATHDIIKDKRYTVDHFQFHVPITINRCPSGININQEVLKIVKDSDEVTFLGIDRGERHLLYLTLIDKQGKILFQKSLNLVSSKAGKEETQVDYRSKLDVKEKGRSKARQSWKNIENIKDLKQGYLSQVVHEIAKIIVENNAVVVMEDLNMGFKRGRTKVEKQVYQKFEKQLIDKLEYLAFKPTAGIDVFSNGGIAKGYQLAPKFDSFAKLGKQHGIIFYVGAWNTSHVDPVTGFMNLFVYPKNGKWGDFFSRFASIKFDADNDYFVFDFDYSKFNVRCKDYRKTWSMCSFGSERLYNWKNSMHKFETKTINVTEDIKQLLDSYGIDYLHGEDLRKQLLQMKQKDLNHLGWLFKQLCNLRNSETGMANDYILSPVADKSGRFYDSRNAKDQLEPNDADANGAYHIALKGLQLAEGICKEKGKDKLKVPYLKNVEWVEWVQKFHERA